MKIRLILWAALLCGTIFRANAQGVEFRDLTFRQALEQAQKEGKLVFMDCYTSWCGPCKMMKPVLEELKKKMRNKIIILKIDIDKNISLSSEYRIQSVPTLVLWKQGEIIWRQSGALSLNELEQILLSYIR